MAESNEQFQHSHSLERTLVRYMLDTDVEDERVSPESARESAYVASLTNLQELISVLEPDPLQWGKIMREVIPPRFDEENDFDVELWVSRLRQVPIELMKRGHINIADERVSVAFFDELVRWQVTCSKGHGTQCASVSGGCQHELPSHQDACPVQAVGIVLSDEIRLLHFVLHGNYSDISLANKLNFTQNRIEELGELFVKHGLSSRDTVQAFLLQSEEEAMIYASKINGLDSVT